MHRTFPGKSCDGFLKAHNWAETSAIAQLVLRWLV
jgi:hypothetical protein